MYRRAVLFSTYGIMAILLFSMCKSNKQEKTADESPAPLKVSALSAPFAQSFAKLLSSYYELKDAFVESDSLKVNAAASSVLLNADNLRISDIEGDSTGTIKETARQFASIISGSAKAVTREPNLEGKRREFNMMSDALWSLTRTVRFNGEKVYYQYCPMAFDNAGAYWLSPSREISNPYYGEKMLNCGEVSDSLDYSKQ